MTETASPPSASRDSELWNLVQGVELVEVRVIRWNSQLHDLHAQAVGELDPDFNVEFRSDAETMQLRWAFDTTLRSRTGKPVADLGLTFLQVFEFTSPHASIRLSNELIQEFAEKTAIISMIPFVREAVQTMTVRLGLPAVTLGLMRAGSRGPQSFSVRGEAH